MNKKIKIGLIVIFLVIILFLSLNYSSIQCGINNRCIVNPTCWSYCFRTASGGSDVIIPECITDNDCETWQGCYSGICQNVGQVEDFWCITNSDCMPQYVCIDNWCRGLI